VPWVLLPLCLAGAGLRHAPAAAQPSSADPPPIPEIIIKAPKHTRRELERVIVSRFVESHLAPTPAGGHIVRWYGAICPGVSGLFPERSLGVERRILDIARRIGAPAATQPCHVNLQVTFSDTPQAFVDDIQTRYTESLGTFRTQGDTRFTRAVQSWYQTGSHRELRYVLVVIDPQQVGVLTLVEVIDDIAMASFSRITRLDTCSELSSILDLLSAACSTRPPPAALTPADIAFLKAIYAHDGALATSSLDDLQNMMLKQLTAQP